MIKTKSGFKFFWAEKYEYFLEVMVQVLDILCYWM